MSPEALLFLVVGWQPLPCCHPPAFPFAQLPPAAVCEAAYKRCEADRAALDYALQYAGGWQRHRLLERRQDVCWRMQVWYACWWVTHPPATREQREDWAWRKAKHEIGGYVCEMTESQAAA